MKSSAASETGLTYAMALTPAITYSFHLLISFILFCFFLFCFCFFLFFTFFLPARHVSSIQVATPHLGACLVISVVRRFSLFLPVTNPSSRAVETFSPHAMYNIRNLTS